MKKNLLLLLFTAVLLSSCSGYFSRDDELIVVKDVIVGDNGNDIIVSYSNIRFTGDFKSQVQKNDLVALKKENITRVLAHNYRGSEKLGVVNDVYKDPNGKVFCKIKDYPPVELKSEQIEKRDYVQILDDGNLLLIEKAPSELFSAIYTLSVTAAGLFLYLLLWQWSFTYLGGVLICIFLRLFMTYGF